MTKDERDQKIWEMHLEGIPEDKIAETFSLSRGAVNRIVHICAGDIPTKDYEERRWTPEQQEEWQREWGETCKLFRRKK